MITLRSCGDISTPSEQLDSRNTKNPKSSQLRLISFKISFGIIEWVDRDLLTCFIPPPRLKQGRSAGITDSVCHFSSTDYYHIRYNAYVFPSVLFLLQ